MEQYLETGQLAKVHLQNGIPIILTMILIILTILIILIILKTNDESFAVVSLKYIQEESKDKAVNKSIKPILLQQINYKLLIDDLNSYI